MTRARGGRRTVKLAPSFLQRVYRSKNIDRNEGNRESIGD